MDAETERWEDEGGAPRKQWSEMTRDQRASFLYSIMYPQYPNMVYSEMDGAVFIQTLNPLHKGDIIEHNGQRFTVLYGWHWTTYGPIPVYMAELEPEGFDRNNREPDSRMGNSDE